MSKLYTEQINNIKQKYHKLSRGITFWWRNKTLQHKKKTSQITNWTSSVQDILQTTAQLDALAEILIAVI